MKGKYNSHYFETTTLKDVPFFDTSKLFLVKRTLMSILKSNIYLHCKNMEIESCFKYLFVGLYYDLKIIS